MKGRKMAEAHESGMRKARAIFPIIEKSDDHVMPDLLTQRMQAHDKTACMFLSLLEK
ncbi:MAG: hypothetical protein ABI618_01125 [Nitrospirota bacterium]